jgi:hypothetical protein
VPGQNADPFVAVVATRLGVTDIRGADEVVQRYLILDRQGQQQFQGRSALPRFPSGQGALGEAGGCGQPGEGDPALVRSFRRRDPTCSRAVSRATDVASTSSISVLIPSFGNIDWPADRPAPALGYEPVRIEPVRRGRDQRKCRRPVGRPRPDPGPPFGGRDRLRIAPKRTGHHMHGFLSRDGMNPVDLLDAGRDEVKGYGGELFTGVFTELIPNGHQGFWALLGDGRRLCARKVLVATGLRDELPEIAGLADR